jgi:hypothetical protein
MNKEFIPYEQALGLKELGFDENCFAHFVKHYNEIKCILNSDDFDEWWTNNSDNLECKAPLYQQAFRWFREVYNLESVIQKADNFTWHKWKISKYNEDGKKQIIGHYEYDTYKEAELACVIKLIEIVKNNNND